MSKPGFAVTYKMPLTKFEVSLTRRAAVQTTSAGSFLRAVVDVDVSSAVEPEPGSHQHLAIDIGLLEKLELKFTFDDNGLIESVNSESSRDITPVIGLVGKVVGLAAVTMGAARAQDRSLEVAWDATHETLGELRTGLSARSEALMRTLCETSEPSEIVVLGAALDVVQPQLSAIDLTRRAWIASQATADEPAAFTFVPDELVLVPGAGPLPAALGSPEVPPAQSSMAAIGALLAICDPDRPARRPERPANRQIDHLVLRSPRPVEVGVYRHVDDQWRLEPGSILKLDVVDRWSVDGLFSLNGSWMRTRKLDLSFHADKSVATFGLTSASSISSIASSVGGVVDSVGTVGKAWKARPTEDAAALAKAKTQLDLAKTANEMETLSATRDRAAELALLEQEKKIRDART
jgi:hypothetical protein